MKNNMKNYFQLMLFFSAFLLNSADIFAYEKKDISFLVKNDSTFFFIDGEKKTVNEEITKIINNENISSSFVLFGENVKETFGSNQVMIIITEKNKDNAKVKDLLALINEKELPMSKSNQNEVIEKKTTDVPSKNFSKMYILDLRTASTNEIEQLTEELKKNNIYTTPIKYSFSEGKLNSLDFSWNNNKKRKKFIWNDNNNNKNCLLILTNENGIIEIKKIIE